MPTKHSALRCGASKDDAMRKGTGKRRAVKAAYALLILLLGSVMLLSACSVKPKNPEDIFEGRSGNYAASARIYYKSLKAEAEISQETPAACSVVFKSPRSLKDMAFIFRQDSVDLSYKGLSFRFEQDSVPMAAVARLTVSAISHAMRGDGIEATLTGDEIEMAGTLENGDFVLRVNAKTGNPIKLLIPAEELEIEFDNFTFLD